MSELQGVKNYDSHRAYGPSQVGGIQDAPSKSDQDAAKTAMQLFDLLCELFSLLHAGKGSTDRSFQRILSQLNSFISGHPDLGKILGGDLFNKINHFVQDVDQGKYVSATADFPGLEDGIAGYMQKNKSILLYMLEHMGSSGGIPNFSDSDSNFLGNIAVILLTIGAANDSALGAQIASEFFGYVGAMFGGGALAEVIMMHIFQETGHWGDAIWMYSNLLSGFDSEYSSAPQSIKDIIDDLKKTPLPNQPIDQSRWAYDLEQIRKAFDHFLRNT